MSCLHWLFCAMGSWVGDFLVAVEHTGRARWLRGRPDGERDRNMRSRERKEKKQTKKKESKKTLYFKKQRGERQHHNKPVPGDSATN